MLFFLIYRSLHETPDELGIGVSLLSIVKDI